MVGVAGCAQQGAATASAPTNVSIATSSSGNYDNAVIIHDKSGVGALFDDDGSNFSGGAISISVPVNQLPGAYGGNAVEETLAIGAYLRATGATSFSWDVELLEVTLSGGNSATTSGTASTSQDVTDATSGERGEMGEAIVITFGGSKSGVVYPSQGDAIEARITASATNANGTTNAAAVGISIGFT